MEWLFNKGRQRLGLVALNPFPSVEYTRFQPTTCINPKQTYIEIYNHLTYVGHEFDILFTHFKKQFCATGGRKLDGAARTSVVKCAEIRRRRDGTGDQKR